MFSRKLGGRTILVADDKQELLEMLADALGAAGADVLTARNGEEALAQLRACRVDALVSDLKMPRMNGHELLRALRAMTQEDKRTLPAIAVSGEESWKYLDPFAAALAGFDYHFIKPVPPDVLVEQLARLLPRDGGRPKSQRRLPRVA